MILKPKIELLNSYIKDLSVEVLDPLVLIKHKSEETKINIDISGLTVKHRNLNDSIYEVVTECKILLTHENNKAMALQTQYAGLFTINEGDEANLTKLIYVDCANILYPFLRSEIANISLSAGFSSIRLPYINFAEQYKELESNKKLH